MSHENLMFDIKRCEEKAFYSISVAGGFLEIKDSKIRLLPTTLRRKFETQKKISFRVLMTAINYWLM